MTREDIKTITDIVHKTIYGFFDICGDAIDRSEAIYIASGYCHPANVAKELAKLPPVTPAPKIGHWIHFASGDDCSECGWSTGKYISPSKYCPNCGCKMQEIPTD